MCGLALFASTTSAEAAIRTWKAFPTDPNWSNPVNWEEGVAPANGDELRFPQPAVTPATVVNDIVNLQVLSISTSGNFTITGQPFALANGLSGMGFGGGTATYDVHITLTADQVWPVDSYHVVLNAGLALNGHTLETAAGKLGGSVTIPGVVSGSGSLRNSGTCRLELLNANTYSGPTFAGGLVKLGHQKALGVGDGTIANGTGGANLDFASSFVLGNERIHFTGGSMRTTGTTFTGPIRLENEVSAFGGMFDFDGPLEVIGSLPSSLAKLTVAVGVVDLSGAELSIALPEGFHPAMGQALRIIDVWDANPVAGTFTGLPEGASITSGGVTFAISYTGGVGNNDVVLTVTGINKSYYLSEGATGSFFSTDILLANPNATAAPVTVTFLKSSGTPVVVSQSLPAFSRRTLHVDDIDGMENASFSTVVRSDDGLPIVAERTMSWDQTGYGSHTERAIDGPSNTWYFAEGSQGFFSTYVLLTNPRPDANEATVEYLIEGAPAIMRTYPLDPESRFTIDVGADAELRGKTFGMTVTFDQPGIAERAMYFGMSPLWYGGHESVGVTAPSTSWFLAEGATGTFFETFVLLANPNAIDVTATVRFMPAAGSPVTKTKVIPANSRVTINIEQEDASLAAAPVATTVTAQLPIIVERSQYWPDPASQWYEAHNSFGVTALGTKWGSPKAAWAAPTTRRPIS